MMSKFWKEVVRGLRAAMLFICLLIIIVLFAVLTQDKTKEVKVDYIKERLVDFKKSDDIKVTTRIKLDTETGCLYWGTSMTPVIGKDKQNDCNIKYIEEYKREKK